MDSKFRGVDISLEGMSAVRFQSGPADGHVITPGLTLFENSLIRGLRTGPDPLVLDLARPEVEVIFDAVQFVNVTFSGWFRAEWFRNSRFEDCVLPPSLDPEALRERGNRVEETAQMADQSP